MTVKVKEVISEEASRLNMTVKVVETGGVKLGQKFCKQDLTGCIFPDCLLCKCESKGASHTRSGALYCGVCTLCKENGVSSKYHGETGYSAYHRMKEHESDVRNGDMSNAFTKHLSIYHPDRKEDISVFSMKSERVFKKCLERQVAEGVEIKNSTADILLNSKAEFHQPAVSRVTTTRDPQARGRGL